MGDSPIQLSRREARRFLLVQQGLWPPHSLRGKAGILATIHRLACIQFDPLNIVGQNPDLVLQARVADYRPSLLNELLYQDRVLLDGFDKNMSIYALEDWPYFRRRREAFARSDGTSRAAVRAVLSEVRSEIEQHGPLSSLDLAFHEKVDWSWSATRLSAAALESMYLWGELIIHHKVNTRRVYDLAHRHLPQALLQAEDPFATDDAYHDWYVHRRIGSIGLVWNRSSEAWLGVARLKSPQRQTSLNRLVEQGQVLEARVEGINLPAYLRAEDLGRLEQSLAQPEPEPRAAIIAPLDNLLWDRRMVKELFDFDYRWEVYKPQALRSYGYYVLPVLYGDRFVARFEPGRAGKSGPLLVKNWWWEAGVERNADLAAALRAAMQRFLAYLGTDELVVGEGAALDWWG